MKGTQKNAGKNKVHISTGKEIKATVETLEILTLAQIWENLSQNEKDKNLFICTGQLTNEINNLLKFNGFTGEDLEKYSKNPETEKSKLPSTVQEFWESLTPKVQEEIIESQEVNVQIEIDLEELGIDAYEFADYVFLTIAPQREQEQAEQTKLEQEVIEVQELTEEVNEITEVNTATEILTQTPTTEMKNQEVVKQKASNETVNNTQNITNNTLNVILDKPKPKMSIADKIVEAQKMLLLAERKQLTEDRLKAFHGYLHANREGDNFTLSSLDKAYSFSTNNMELIKEVNIVLERFLKNKIQEFETELANFQLV